MMRICRALSRLNDHWIGDLIGVFGLFATGYAVLLVGCGLGLQ